MQLLEKPSYVLNYFSFKAALKVLHYAIIGSYVRPKRLFKKYKLRKHDVAAITHGSLAGVALEIDCLHFFVESRCNAPNSRTAGSVGLTLLPTSFIKKTLRKNIYF